MIILKMPMLGLEKVREHVGGSMAKVMWGSGKMIRWKEQVYSSIKIKVSIKVNLK